MTIILLYLCLELVFPSKPLISVSAASFAAMLPMHVAMTASVNNDVLSELLLMATMLALLHWMQGQYYADQTPAQPAQRRQLMLVGFLLGLGMLTKFYAYLLLPLVLLVVLLVGWLRPRVEPGIAPGRGTAPSAASDRLGDRAGSCAVAALMAAQRASTACSIRWG